MINALLEVLTDPTAAPRVDGVLVATKSCDAAGAAGGVFAPSASALNLAGTIKFGWPPTLLLRAAEIRLATPFSAARRSAATIWYLRFLCAK